jgi:hypothetical protein
MVMRIWSNAISRSAALFCWLAFALAFGPLRVDAGETGASDWIAASCAIPGGALAEHPGGSDVSPYFANITATGLAFADLHLEIVRNWLSWYLEHSSGSVTGIEGVADDVHSQPGKPPVRALPDSTDAYGATFLILARTAFRTGDEAIRELIGSNKRKVVQITQSMLATQQPNGLTFASPNYPVAYTMDNAQVYQGLLASAFLMGEAYHDAHREHQLWLEADNLRSAIDLLLWDSQTQAFRPYIRASEPLRMPDLTLAYPDAMAEAFAVIYGVVDPRSPLAWSLLDRITPALSTVKNGDAEQFRVLLAVARRAATGTPVYVDNLAPLTLCSEAGWLLQAQGGSAL